MKAPDWIRLLEASYELEHDEVAWRQRVLESAAPLFGPRVLGLCVAQTSGSGVEVEISGILGPAKVRQQGLKVIAAAPPRALDLLWRSGAVVGSLNELVFSRLPGARELFFEASGGLVRDAISVLGRLDSERTLALLSPRAELASTTREERYRWHQAMCHVAAGLRLRRAALAVPSAGGPDADAILDPSGRVHDANGAARSTSALESLRAAVKNIERARSSKGRRDPIVAMENWRGLVDGRWSLVDRFDADGKRFVVAVKNDPEVLDPRGLSKREQQVAELVGLGRSTKEIAYELGLSLSAVSMTAGKARRKLGLGSRTELASFFSPAGVRERLAEAAIEGERLLVGAHPLLDSSTLERLSPAERLVAAALLGGSTSAEVAARRGTSRRTGANQIASIFEKLGVVSRVELAARLQAAGPSSADVTSARSPGDVPDCG